MLIHPERQLELKLAYLCELRELIKTEAFTREGLGSIVARYIEVCDSVERDLKIGTQ